MKLEVRKTTLDGVLIIKPITFDDFRGQYVETYNEKDYASLGIDTKFVQDDFSISDKHVLRGIHGDDITSKLVSCICGRFYLVVVNCDKTSENFGKWEGFTLSDRTFKQVFIPAKYGNGHVVLSNKAIFHYKQSSYYGQAKQFTYKWNDPVLDLWWPINNPILSIRDQ